MPPRCRGHRHLRVDGVTAIGRCSDAPSTARRGFRGCPQRPSSNEGACRKGTGLLGRRLARPAELGPQQRCEAASALRDWLGRLGRRALVAGSGRPRRRAPSRRGLRRQPRHDVGEPVDDRFESASLVGQGEHGVELSAVAMRRCSSSAGSTVMLDGRRRRGAGAPRSARFLVTQRRRPNAGQLARTRRPCPRHLPVRRPLAAGHRDHARSRCVHGVAALRSAVRAEIRRPPLGGAVDAVLPHPR